MTVSTLTILIANVALDGGVAVMVSGVFSTLNYICNCAPEQLLLQHYQLCLL